MQKKEEGGCWGLREKKKEKKREEEKKVKFRRRRATTGGQKVRGWRDWHVWKKARRRENCLGISLCSCVFCSSTL